MWPRLLGDGRTTEKSNWYEVALVRSGFGHPVTATDGVTVFRANRQACLRR